MADNPQQLRECQKYKEEEELGKLRPCCANGKPQGGGTLVFLYMRRLGSILGVQNFEFQYFWGFQKKNFGGCEDFVDIFFWGGGGGNHKIGLYLGIISMHFRVFS